jgi:hypothetical protein
LTARPVTTPPDAAGLREVGAFVLEELGDLSVVGARGTVRQSDQGKGKDGAADRDKAAEGRFWLLALDDGNHGKVLATIRVVS